MVFHDIQLHLYEVDFIYFNCDTYILHLYHISSMVLNSCPPKFSLCQLNVFSITIIVFGFRNFLTNNICPFLSDLFLVHTMFYYTVVYLNYHQLRTFYTYLTKQSFPCFLSSQKLVIFCFLLSISTLHSRKYMLLSSIEQSNHPYIILANIQVSLPYYMVLSTQKKPFLPATTLCC